jgi:hypothetical protein
VVIRTDYPRARCEVDDDPNPALGRSGVVCRPEPGCEGPDITVMNPITGQSETEGKKEDAESRWTA